MARLMKDSGIEWIGEIPEDWEVARLKQVFDFGKGLPITKEDLVDKGIPVISYGQIHAKSNTGVAVQQELIRYVSDTFRETNSGSFVYKNDFILADTSEDLLGCGNCVFVDRAMELFAGYHTIILRSTTTQDNKYLAYLFLTDAWRSQIRSKVSGVKLFSISRKILSEATVLVPPTDVQHRIAAFLDRRCAEIDAVIERTKATIEEYKKLKQAVITEAVTKGVRGPRPMKDSGIEWIGEIPEGWRTTALKRICRRISDGSHFSPETTSTGKPYVTAGDIHGKGIDYTCCRTISEEAFELMVKAGCQPHKGDVLIVKDGATTGRVGLMTDDENCVLLSSVAMISPAYGVDSTYLMYLMESKALQHQISNSMAGSAMPRITLIKLVAYTVIDCPEEEQIEIATYLDEKCAALDTLIAKKTALLTELETYKKSLIYEYVTGKKEVQDGYSYSNAC